MACWEQHKNEPLNKEDAPVAHFRAAYPNTIHCKRDLYGNILRVLPDPHTCNWYTGIIVVI